MKKRKITGIIMATLVTASIGMGVVANADELVGETKEKTKVEKNHDGEEKAYVNIKDSNLRAVINGHLGQASDAKITIGQLEGLTVIYGPNKGISSLDGLENCKNLKQLTLTGNKINDISQIKDLGNLEEVLISGNNISDISALQNKPKLWKLNMSGNKINDISHLKNSINLSTLVASNNNIKDISVLKNIKGLDFVNLNNNNIADASALSEITELSMAEVKNQKVTIKVEGENGNISLKAVKGVNEKLTVSNITSGGKFENGNIKWTGLQGESVQSYNFKNNFDSKITPGEYSGIVTVSVNGGQIVEPPITPPVEPPVTPPVEPPVTPPVTPEVTVKTGTVTASVLNVRSGQGTSHSVIGSLRNGAKVEIVSTSNGWHKIKFNGKTGFVSADYIKVDGDNSGEVAVSKGIVTASVLNVRNGQGTNHGVIGSLRNGAQVEIISTSNGWHKIKFNGGVGYISADYVRSNEVAPEVPEVSTGKGTVAASVLNVRSGQGTSHRVIGSLRNGAQVEIVSTSNGWHKIKFNGNIGYVSAEYINTGETSGNVKTVTASALNVRSGQGTSHRVIGSLRKGSKVNILSTSNGWHKISYNGTIGYISVEYVR